MVEGVKSQSRMSSSIRASRSKSISGTAPSACQCRLVSAQGLTTSGSQACVEFWRPPVDICIGLHPSSDLFLLVMMNSYCTTARVIEYQSLTGSYHIATSLLNTSPSLSNSSSHVVSSLFGIWTWFLQMIDSTVSGMVFFHIFLFPIQSFPVCCSLEWIPLVHQNSLPPFSF